MLTIAFLLAVVGLIIIALQANNETEAERRANAQRIADAYDEIWAQNWEQKP